MNVTHGMDIIKHPYLTEKSVDLIEESNTLVFMVDERAHKPDIKEAVQEAFDVDVANVNTQNTFKGGKKAYVKLSESEDAFGVATDLGML
jgi:ribosomal protein uL23